jgi:hypothetical protein
MKLAFAIILTFAVLAHLSTVSALRVDKELRKKRALAGDGDGDGDSGGCTTIEFSITFDEVTSEVGYDLVCDTDKIWNVARGSFPPSKYKGLVFLIFLLICLLIVVRIHGYASNSGRRRYEDKNDLAVICLLICLLIRLLIGLLIKMESSLLGCSKGKEKTPISKLRTGGSTGKAKTSKSKVEFCSLQSVDDNDDDTDTLITTPPHMVEWKIPPSAPRKKDVSVW